MWSKVTTIFLGLVFRLTNLSDLYICNKNIFQLPQVYGTNHHIISSRADFTFVIFLSCHYVNFPFLSSNIPSSPSNGVHISQSIRYARCCSHYDDFGYCHKLLVDRLLSQGYEVNRLGNSLNKFHVRFR